MSARVQGEVYRAFDLKLRVDVALKAVRPELSSSEKARELLRQEVRSAREVVSPNVCRRRPRDWELAGRLDRGASSLIRSSQTRSLVEAAGEGRSMAPSRE